MVNSPRNSRRYVKTAEVLLSFRYATDGPSLGWLANSMVWTSFV
jgi:hypothetical protein